MREIKFRAWHKVNKIMHQPCSMVSNWDQKTMSYLSETPLCIFMQYTGLKDKNGKEIYEGDIVKNRWGDNKEVSFSEIDFCTYDGSCSGYGFVLEDQHLSDYKQTVEIIGNIYENKELITK